MPSTPPTPAELASYREQADRFVAELDEEDYLHAAGLKDELELVPIYERHAELTDLAWAQALGAAIDGDHRLRELWRFACAGYVGNLTREHAEKIGGLEASLEATVDGEQIPFRMLRPEMANAEDRSLRERLDHARTALGEEHLNPVYLEASEVEQRAVRALGAPDAVELHRRFGFRLDELAVQARRFLDSTERLYERTADRLFRERIGLGLDEAERWDTVRVFRAPEWDPFFPKERMLPALEATLADLGINLDAQPNVELDIEQRPKKSPRPFCAPIEVPGRVVLVLQPIGGPDDWRGLFHEAGHTEHFAHTSPDLSVEERRFGDNAVTEGWAMLLEHLTDDPTWLDRRLDVPRTREFAVGSAALTLFLVRRYCAKLLYELELHAADDVRPLRSRYVELLGDALKVEPSPTDWLADVDPGFYVTSYVRAWAFEAQMHFHLRERFGNDWFASREAGFLLRELWELGQKPTADELLHEVTGSEIDLDAVAERLGEHLA